MRALRAWQHEMPSAPTSPCGNKRAEGVQTGRAALQVPKITDASSPPVTELLQALGTADVMLKKLTPADADAPDSWQVLYTVQLVHAVAAPLMFAQVRSKLAVGRSCHECICQSGCW